MCSQLFIVNQYDRPDERNLAELRNGKYWYVHPELSGMKYFFGMTHENATPVEAFGIEITRDKDRGVIIGKLTGETRANYRRDGSPRRWQGAYNFEFSGEIGGRTHGR